MFLYIYSGVDRTVEMDRRVEMDRVVEVDRTEQWRWRGLPPPSIYLTSSEGHVYSIQWLSTPTSVKCWILLSTHSEPGLESQWKGWMVEGFLPNHALVEDQAQNVAADVKFPIGGLWRTQENTDAFSTLMRITIIHLSSNPSRNDLGKRFVWLDGPPSVSFDWLSIPTWFLNADQGMFDH